MSFMDGFIILILIALVVASVVILIRRASYDGQIVIEQDDITGKIIYSLELETDPNDIQHMKHVSFKVVHKEIAE